MTSPFHSIPGFGFAVVLTNAPSVEIFGETHADVDSNLISLVVTRAVALWGNRWTGAHLRWARRFMKLTHDQLAHLFRVERSTVTKWESRRDKTTGMPWTTEHALRAQLLGSLGETELGASTLLSGVQVHDSAVVPLTIDWNVQPFGYAVHRWLRSCEGAGVMQDCRQAQLPITAMQDGSRPLVVRNDGGDYDVAG
jgi:hypothetical protein